MTDEELLARIRTSPQLAEDLAWLDFDLARVRGVAELPEPVTFAGELPFDVVAGSADGGYYLLVGEPQRSGRRSTLAPRGKAGCSPSGWPTRLRCLLGWPACMTRSVGPGIVTAARAYAPGWRRA